MRPGASMPVSRRQKVGRFVVAIVLAVLGLWIVRGFLPALAWAGVIAIAVEPLRLRIIARWPSLANGAALPALMTLAIGLLVLVPVGFGIAQAAAEAQDVSGWLVAARQGGVPVPQWVGELPFGSQQVTRWWQDHLSTAQAAETQLRMMNAQTILYHSRLVGSGLLRRVVTFAFTLFALFFLLRDGSLIAAQLRVAGSRLLGSSGERIGHQVIQSVRGTIDGLVLVGIGEGLVMTIAYLLAGVSHPLLLGAATAVAAMIPFGAALMFAIAAVLLVVQSAIYAAIAVVVFGFVVVAIADHIVRPVLIGGATRLPFLWVLIGILGGVESFGLLGLFVGPATMAVLVMLWREFLAGQGAAVPVEGVATASAA